MKRTRLYDRNWKIIWDSETSTEPAYPLIAAAPSHFLHAITDDEDGLQWVGQVHRCPEGVKRFSLLKLDWLTDWPNPYLPQTSDVVSKK